jgi:RNA polymerase sigma-70 factor (ECF subfamily)
MPSLGKKKVTVSLTQDQHDEIQRLWKDHAGAVHSMLLSWCGNPTDAGDILQEVFLRIARQPQTLKSIRQPRSFLVVAARRIGIDLARKRAAEQRRDDTLEIEISSSPDGRDDEEMKEIFQRALATLPIEQKIVLESKIIHGKTLAVIASEQGITINTAASRLRYSLDKMRNELRPHYETMKKSPFYPQNASALHKPIEQGERLIKPLDAKRVPSVVPGFEGLVALVPEHTDHLHEPDIVSDSFDHHDHEMVDSVVQQPEDSHENPGDHPAEENLLDSPNDNPIDLVDALPQPDDTELMVATLFEETNIEEHVDPLFHVDPFPFENIVSVEIVPETDHVDSAAEGVDASHDGEMAHHEVDTENNGEGSIQPVEGTLVLDGHSDFEGGVVLADGATAVDPALHVPEEVMHDFPVAYSGAHNVITMVNSDIHPEYAKEFSLTDVGVIKYDSATVDHGSILTLSKSSELDPALHLADASQLRGATIENSTAHTSDFAHPTMTVADGNLNLSKPVSETIVVESQGSLTVDGTHHSEGINHFPADGKLTNAESSHDATSTAINEAFHSSNESGSVTSITTPVHHSPVEKLAAHGEVGSHLTSSIDTNPTQVVSLPVNVSASNSPIVEQAHTEFHPQSITLHLPEILPLEANEHTDIDHSGHEADDFVVVAVAPASSVSEISEASEAFSSDASASHDIQTSEVLGGAFVAGTATQSSGLLTQKRHPILK